MKKAVTIFFISFCLFQNLLAQAGKVGVNTTTPAAMLHVKDSSVLFTGIYPAIPTNPPPVSGAGTRMMWYADKRAFRAGMVTGSHWNKDSIGLYSLAIGNNVKARGASSTALGNSSIAYGANSLSIGDGTMSIGYSAIALGGECTALGDYSVAIGGAVNASGLFSTALGYFSTANAPYSTAFGRETVASGDISTAFGVYSRATGFYSTAFGFQSTSSGAQSTSMGTYTIASGTNSTSCGRETKAQGHTSAAFGYGSYANGYSSTVLGYYNDTIVAPQTGILASTPLFIIGNGTSHNARSNAMTVLKNGNVGIGTSTPGFLLNFPNALGDKISLWGNSGPHYGFGIQNNTLQIHTDLQASDVVFGYGTSAALTETMRIKGNGNVGIANNNPAFKLDVSGRMRLRHGADGTPGIWFNKSDNTAPVSFLGLYNNEYIGIYGDQGSSWNFLMSTISGNIGIGIPSPLQKLHVNGNGLFNGSFQAIKGASGATALSNTIGLFENNNSAYISILTPNANESALLFGNPASSSHGGIIYNAASTTNGLQFRANAAVRMVINNNGFVGIGTTAPTTQLHIRNGASGAIPSSLGAAVIENNDHSNINIMAPADKTTAIWFDHPGEDGSIIFNHTSVVKGFSFQIAGSTKMQITNGGNVSIGAIFSPSEKLEVQGNGKFNGTVTASCGVLSCSDIRYKTNILPLSNSLSNVLMLKGIYYDWDRKNFPDKQFSDHRQIGIIAQDLELYYPELVHTDNSGFKTVEYSRLSPILLEAIKEQQMQIDSLKAEIATLREQSQIIEVLQNQIEFLLKKITDLEKSPNSLVRSE